MKPPTLTFCPLTASRWSDLEKLFGPKGAYGGCWCMWWRETRREFEQKAGEGNRKAFQDLVASGEIPGILGYQGTEPVGWCSVCPRESLPSLNRSRVLKPLDDTPVWSIVCFYVARGHRNHGMMLELIRAAISYVKEKGGKVVEAYPTVTGGRRLPPVSSFMGIPSVFEEAGFKECARPSPSRVVMRYTIP